MTWIALTTAATTCLATAFVALPANAAATPTCFGTPATMVGTEAADRLVGTSGPDVIVGLGGHDVIRGGGGNDLICGGDGNDTLVGGAGNDRMAGQGGSNHQRGGSGNDILLAGFGAVTDQGDETTYYVAQGDWLDGGSGNDVLRPGSPRTRAGAERSDTIGFPARHAVRIDLKTGKVVGQGRDRIVPQPSQARPSLAIIGSPKADTILGATKGWTRRRGQTSVHPARGDDRFRARGGDTRVYETVDLFGSEGWAADAGERIHRGTGSDTYDFSRSPLGSSMTLVDGSDRVVGGSERDLVWVGIHSRKPRLELGRGQDSIEFEGRPTGTSSLGGQRNDEVTAKITSTKKVRIDARTGALHLGPDRVATVRGVRRWFLEAAGPLRYVGSDRAEFMHTTARTVRVSLAGGDDRMRAWTTAPSGSSVDGGRGRDRVTVTQLFGGDDPVGTLRNVEAPY